MRLRIVGNEINQYECEAHKYSIFNVNERTWRTKYFDIITQP